MVKLIAKKLLNLIPDKLKYEIFYQITRSLSIRGYVLDGTQGSFLGATADRTIMRHYLFNKNWSMELVAPIKERLKEGGTFVDVGANIGLLSLSIGKLPNVAVHAIEPDAENFEFLQANIGLHALHNISSIKAAAWDCQTTLQFARNSYNSGDHHIQSSGEQSVSAIPLDSIVGFRRPLVVKIDTQGAEPAVLKGGMKLLNQADLIIIEFWPWGMKRMGLKPNDAVDLLGKLHGEYRLIKNGVFGDWLPISKLSESLQTYTKNPIEYNSVDVMIRK